ncbi:MAG: glycosyltransferase, partial [Actinomycetes bacterium]
MAGSLHPQGAAVVVPAFNEAARIFSTVRAAAAVAGVDLVVVVDDGSSDATSPEAERAGAAVVRLPTNAGKAAAMERGAAEVARLEATAGVLGR